MVCPERVPVRTTLDLCLERVSRAKDQVRRGGKRERATHAGIAGRGAGMAGRKAGWNVHRRNAGSRGPLGSHSGKANVRKVDQPGPGRTGTRTGNGATEEVWNDSEVGGVVVLEDCGGRARVGDSRGGRGLGRLGSFEHAA